MRMTNKKHCIESSRIIDFIIMEQKKYKRNFLMYIKNYIPN
jgi:hypothetical protein